jgi:ABC-type glycerol-3-phosphate transport system permease component
MFILGAQATQDIFSWPPHFLPGDSLRQNYQDMMAIIPFWRNFANSALVSVSHTALSLLFCSMGGYAFAMYQFPGRNQLFALMLATIMIPWMAGIIPWFILISKWLHWINRYEALIIPGAASAFGIFWMRQYVQESIPHELLDAARIDGCPEFTIFFRVVAPLLMPAYAALGILVFVGSWNAFLGPLLVMQEKEMYTLPVALALLRQDPQRGYNAGVLMLGTAMATLPMLIVFLAATRRFMAGLTLGALKG